ncbi:hypothetical protein CDL12_24220 [Handroanthus impetiginosus]|uniref:RBR-type E3 ubiquitin transferase n=1 Tax=Handroanthus impetiginosus TaxID=429701 RepID=A0A2G9GD85_9LAMI|nr:hypothetical protein CDL12_24220 [Handroanthus impetiginosus]
MVHHYQYGLYFVFLERIESNDSFVDSEIALRGRRILNMVYVIGYLHSSLCVYSVVLPINEVDCRDASICCLNGMTTAFIVSMFWKANMLSLKGIQKRRKIETCGICFEHIRVYRMFQILGCLHSYYFSCMSKHAQYKLLEGVLPNCPHENCMSTLKLDTCKRFLSPKLVNMMSQRFKEAFIPAEDKIYCPNPRCSVLFPKKELQGYEGSSRGATKCPNCSDIFCIKCKVPWHDNMTCSAYRRKNPHASIEERELHSLATRA